MLFEKIIKKKSQLKYINCIFEGFTIHNYNDVATYLLYQQLFLDPNLIRDRRSEKMIPVEGSEKIIRKMHQLILSEIDLWDKGKEDQYLANLVKKIGISLAEVKRKYKLKLEPLSEDQFKDKSFKLLLLLSEIISEIHKKSTNEIIKHLQTDFKGKMTKKIVTERIDQLSQESIADFSLLLNLGILCEYAKIVQEPIPLQIYAEYLEKVKKLIKKEK